MSVNDPLIGRQLGDYRLTEVIGQGGMGRVYKGYDEKLARYAAVKVFDATGVIGEDIEEYRERFQREARAIARLRHPNIVDVYQFGQIDSLYYMAMVMVEGRDLRNILKEHAARGEQMPPDAMLRVMTDVASALDYAHSEGVIHRDVKPSNIMIMADGHAILTDFGLALNVPEGTIGTTFGSVHYIAPEQAMNSAMAVPQSDLYSLGVILYEMFTGKVPFDDQSAMSVALQHLSETPPPLRRYRPNLKPEVEAMVLRALEKEPENRYANCTAMVAALENVLGMTDEDEKTREIVLPDWARDPQKLAERVGMAAGKSEKTPAPAPVFATADDDTLEDRPARSAAAKPAPGSTPSAASPASYRRRNIGIGAAALVMIVVIALALGARGESGGNGDTIITPTEDYSGVALAVTATDVTATDVPADLTEPTESMSAAEPEKTLEPTEPESPTSVVTMATDVALVATAATVTQAGIASGEGDEGQVLLVYDEGTLILLNRSDEPVDIRGLTFVQPVEEGRDLAFPTRRWAGGSAPTSALPAGDCFQVWTTEITEQPVPEICNARHKWDQASSPRWFWISDSPDTLFEVRRGETVLAECRVGAGECVIDLG